MVRKIGPFVATRPTGIAERSALAGFRQQRVGRWARYGSGEPQPAAELVTRVGDDAVFHIKQRVYAGLNANDYESYKRWKRHRRAVAQRLETRDTAVKQPGGKA